VTEPDVERSLCAHFTPAHLINNQLQNQESMNTTLVYAVVGSLAAVIFLSFSIFVGWILHPFFINTRRIDPDFRPTVKYARVAAAPRRKLAIFLIGMKINNPFKFWIW